MPNIYVSLNYKSDISKNVEDPLLEMWTKGEDGKTVHHGASCTVSTVVGVLIEQYAAAFLVVDGALSD